MAAASAARPRPGPHTHPPPHRPRSLALRSIHARASGAWLRTPRRAALLRSVRCTACSGGDDYGGGDGTVRVRRPSLPLPLSTFAPPDPWRRPICPPTPPHPTPRSPPGQSFLHPLPAVRPMVCPLRPRPPCTFFARSSVSPSRRSVELTEPAADWRPAAVCHSPARPPSRHGGPSRGTVTLCTLHVQLVF